MQSGPFLSHGDAAGNLKVFSNRTFILFYKVIVATAMNGDHTITIPGNQAIGSKLCYLCTVAGHCAAGQYLNVEIVSAAMGRYGLTLSGIGVLVSIVVMGLGTVLV